jgi:hypothetical protein
MRTGMRSRQVQDNWSPVQETSADEQNFMKCLMKMHAKDNNGVLFYETICSFREQRHTFIEAVPLPYEQFQDAPAYFRVRLYHHICHWSLD